MISSFPLCVGALQELLLLWVRGVLGSEPKTARTPSWRSARGAHREEDGHLTLIFFPSPEPTPSLPGSPFLRGLRFAPIAKCKEEGRRLIPLSPRILSLLRIRSRRAQLCAEGGFPPLPSPRLQLSFFCFAPFTQPGSMVEMACKSAL